ncbi:MAG TPA: hypothetical protein VK633_10095 [Verrucomicrobiae bacterium]|nr:hypothetical protein [Verrucomicrobiae bacterium]
MTLSSLGISAGWVSHSGSFSDCMPVWNESKDICLIFSGEVYPNHSEVDTLRKRGHEFAPANAQYLVHAYEEFGLEFLETLNGWFCGIVIDLRKSKILLFNDRYGIGRIYFHENEAAFFFSSEAKSLLKVLPELREFDFRGLGEFFSFGCVLQNRTLFSSIALLPAGSVWTFNPGATLKKHTYFDPATWEQQSRLNTEDYYESLKETWRQLLPRYIRPKESAALSLTGGLDSRMILAWAARSAGTLPCYTFGGTYRDCADVTISREVARLSMQKHAVIPVGSDFLTRFRDLSERAVYISDGAIDVTGAVDVYVQEKARVIAPVRITGTNGGEMLRSLVAFKPNGFCEDLLDPKLSGAVKDASTTYAGELQGHRLSFTAFKQAAWYMGSKFALERSQITLRMPYFDNDLIKLIYRAPCELAQSSDPSRWLISEGNPALGGIATDRGGSPGAAPIVAGAQRLFHELTFKAEYAYDYGMPQWLTGVDRVLRPFGVERLFLGRHKFAHFRTWYRRELSPYLKDVLLDAPALTRPYLRGVNVEKMVSAHVKGHGNYTTELHKILSTELMVRQLFEQN